VKEDFLHHFSLPHLDLLAWVLVTKLAPTYYRKLEVMLCYDNGLIRLNFHFLLLNRFWSHMTQDWMTRTHVTHC
jgi:hypothetical protein